MLVVPETTLALPIIDISPFLASSEDVKKDPSAPAAAASYIEQAKKATGELIDKACREVGFFYLTGHGIPEEDLQEVRQLARDFFALPLEEKEEISIAKTDKARGFQRLGQNITKYAKDWHEAIDLYAPVGPDHTLIKKNLKVLTGTNPWPRNPPNFKDKFEAYVEKMKRLGLATMRAIAMGLKLDEHFFDPFMTDSFWVMRIIGYPPLQSGKENSDNVGVSCGEHTDYGCLTLLNTDETTGALQVMSKSGEWINADPVPGAFVVNIGDMLNNWTNDLYKSTLHRVIHTKSSYRVSIPFFYEPSFDAVIEPLDVCIKECAERQKKEASQQASSHQAEDGLYHVVDVKRYKPVVYGEHLVSKVSSNFDISDGM
ncbi:hypothetical protein HK102_010421 [Quaeritorhiza haematococci]|nr:hypothetical protein HK102_010421 [Quaeritorhiza haematococci]